MKLTKEDFKSNLERYHKQLITGCGKAGCDNQFCFSCPAIQNQASKLSPTEAGLLALKLVQASKPESLQKFHCSTDAAKSENFLDLPLLKKLLAEAQSSDNFVPLGRIIGSVFGSPESLTLSFLKPPKSVRLNQTDTGLDFDQVKEAYEIIATLPFNIQSILVSSCERLMGELKRYYSAPTDLKDLRKFLILLEYPHLTNKGVSKSLMTPLYFLVSEFPPQMKKFICEVYLASFDRKKFLALHEKLQSFISLRILSDSYPADLHKNLGVVSTVKFLDLLWTQNQSLKYLKLGDFYNATLNEYFSEGPDFRNWQFLQQARGSNKSAFAFAKHPWILNPETKSSLLQLESLSSQAMLQEESLQMLAHGYGETPYLHIKVRRSYLIDDSLDSIFAQKFDNIEALKKPLKVKFEGEQGIDEGGVQKEWFQLLVAEIFSVKFGMFLLDEETRTHFFNPHLKEYESQFELLGIVLGLAIYNGVILDLHFPDLVYKKLCGLPVSLIDLKGLTAILEYNEDNFTEVFDLRFSCDTEYLGAVKTHDLVPKGSEIPVTKENRQLYVDLYVEYLLETSIRSQWNAFKKGFDDLCKGPAIGLFEPEELHLLICGSPELDFLAFEKATTYDNGYHKDHPNIINFWSVVHEFSEEQKRQLLFFATGSDRSPIGGLEKLMFIISRHGDEGDRLPSAHTCFNHLLLPEYSSREVLKKLLLKSLENSTGFGMI